MRDGGKGGRENVKAGGENVKEEERRGSDILY